MKASVGDRLVQASSVVDGTVREGTVIEVRHEDGSPPYAVRWLDTGEVSVVFPGPDSHVEAPGAEPGTRPGPGEVGRTWRVQISLSHDGRATTAQAVLVGGSPDHLATVGRARRDPDDEPEPGIGDEVAVARALRRLADRLMDDAEDQIEDSTGRPARVHG